MTPTEYLDPTSVAWRIITPRTYLTPTPTPTLTSTSTKTPPIIRTLPPSLTATPTSTITKQAPPCLQTTGVIQQDRFESDILKGKVSFKIYLPACYDSVEDYAYPVLYFLHGLYSDFNQWDDLGADEAADALIASGEVSPFVIVMPGETSFLNQESSLYGEMIISELIPWIDSHYLTDNRREARAIGGLSRGAAWAIHIGIDNWQSFAAIGTHSLPVIESDGRRMVSKLKAIPASELPNLFLDIGDKDPERPYTQIFEESLTAAGIPHTWYLFQGRHEDSYWSDHVEVYLRWYAQSW